MRASLLTMAPASARGYFGVYTLPRGSEQVPNWSRVQRPVPNRFVLLRVAARGAGGEGAGDAAAGARLDHGAGRRVTSGSVSTRRGRAKPVGDGSDGRQLAWRAWGIRAALMRSAVASRKSTPHRGERLRRRRRARTGLPSICAPLIRGSCTTAH